MGSKEIFMKSILLICGLLFSTSLWSLNIDIQAAIEHTRYDPYELPKEKKLFQSCHILHKQGRYFIVHFKELFLLDGKKSNLEEGDIARRNTIATLMSDWGLVTIQEENKAQPLSPLRQIKIIPFKDKQEWELCPKYNIGRK